MAQKTADEITTVAKQQAEQIIKDAEFSAKNSVEELNTQIMLKEREIEDLKKQFDVYRAKMESLLISQLELLKDIKFDFKKDNGKGLLLNSHEIEVLQRYGFDYKKYSSLNDLIFDIDNYINEEGCFNDVDELEEVLDRISEYHYYNEVNK